MSVPCEYSVLSSKGVCNRPISRPEESYQLCVYVSLCAVSCNSNPLHLQGVCTRGQTKKENVIEMIIEGLCLSVDYPFMVPVLGRISDGNYYQLQDKFRTFLRLLVAPCILRTFNLF